MAETIDYKTKEYAVHHIDCDKCGKHICDSEEYDDGYYYDPSKFEEKICINSTWYRYRTNLCDECKKKTREAMIKMLTDFGFEKERH